MDRGGKELVSQVSMQLATTLISGMTVQCRWEDLILHPMRHLDNTLILMTYRTVDRRPPDMALLRDVRLIEARPFSKATLQSLVLK